MQPLILNSDKEVVQLLLLMEREVVDRWLETPIMQSLFRKYGMDAEYFEEHYAFLLYRSFIDVVSGVKSVFSCPIIHTLIDYFKNRDITPGDLSRFFSEYRRIVVRCLMNRSDVSIERVEGVQEILDYQYEDALTYYNHSFFSKDAARKNDMVRFREYQKAIDKSAIVSKTSPKGIITYANQAFCKVSGYAYDEVIGQTHALIRHNETPNEFYIELWRSISSKKIFHSTIRNRTKGGSDYYVDATIVPILDEDNNIVEYISMSYEVTKLVEALEAAEKAKKAKDQFLANMSHEIRTPLNAILGFIAILRKQISDAKGIHYVDVIQSSSQMLLEIVNDILDLSKLQSGKFAISDEPFDPVAELSSTLMLFSSKAYEKSIRYATYIDPNMPRCLSGDNARIKQILANFLSNAVKFTPKNGIIKVKAVYEGGELRVNVQDNGIGVNPQKQKTIFEAFEQADNSITRNFGGTGLGLSICSQLVTQMGGKIVFRSVENKGSLFGFHIPLSVCHNEIEPFAMLKNRFRTLKVAFYDHFDDTDMVMLLEKYLHDFGVAKIDYLSRTVPQGYDVVFVPAASTKWLLLRELGIPFIVLQSNGMVPSHFQEPIHRLYEPFLPDAMSEVLHSVIG